MRSTGIAQFIFCLAATQLVGGVAAVNFCWSQDVVAQTQRNDAQRNQERDELVQQMLELQKQGETERAISVAEKVLAIEREVFGNTHEEVAGTLKLLAQLNETRENLDAATALRQEILNLRMKRDGEEHWRVAEAREELNYVKLLASLTTEDRQKANSARRLRRESGVFYRQGNPQKALELMQEVLQITSSVFGTEHLDYGHAANNLGLLYSDMGDYLRAEEYLRRAQKITRAKLGPNHPLVTYSLSNLGTLYCRLGDYRRAESALREVYEYRTTALPEHDPEHVGSIVNLATLYLEIGDYARAERLFRQALVLAEKHLRPIKHPFYATNLSNLANLQRMMGDESGAEQLFLRSLKFQRELNEHSLGLAGDLQNLGALYLSIEETEKAEQVLLAASDILTSEFPDATSELAFHHLYFGSVCMKRLDAASAESHLQKALTIRQTSLGEDHPDTIRVLSHLANLYITTRRFQKAATVLSRVAEHDKALRAEELESTRGEHLLGMLDDAMGECDESIKHLRTALRKGRERQMLTANILSGRQQLANATLQKELLDANLSVALRAKVPAEEVYAYVLAWKGSVFARQRRLRRIQDSQNADVIGLFHQLQTNASALVALVMSHPNETHRLIWERQIFELSERKEQLERQLSQLSTEYRNESEVSQCRPVDVQSILPANTALVDFLRYDHHEFSEQGRIVVIPRLTAFVVRREQRIARIDLGPYESVVRAIDQWRANEVEDTTERESKRPLTQELPPGNRPSAGQSRERSNRPELELRHALWDPIERYLEGINVVLVSPDGALGRFPFAALPGKTAGSYLIEDVGLAVVPVPQLLPDMLDGQTQDSKAKPASLLVIGDVDFDGAENTSSTSQISAVTTWATRSGRHHQYGPLPGTKREIQEVREAFLGLHSNSQVALLQSKKATEDAFRRASSGRCFIHLATHGFFAPEELRLSTQRRQAANSFGRSAGDPLSVVIGFHPGILSGVVLAGANHKDDDTMNGSSFGDDGILTALEVAELDLRDCELVVLSACDTGLGQVAGGEGLLGLQRAFQVAGAKSTIASLWKVDDEITRRMMAAFYTNYWAKGMDKLNALRQAQLSVLRGSAADSIPRGPGTRRQVDGEASVGRTPPRLWAAWLLSGVPRDLPTLLTTAPNDDSDRVSKGAAPPRSNVSWQVYLFASLMIVLLTAVAMWRYRVHR